MNTTAVMDLISEKRAELKKILAVGKNLLNKDVLNKSEELDKAILTFMSDNIKIFDGMQVKYTVSLKQLSTGTIKDYKGTVTIKLN